MAVAVRSTQITNPRAQSAALHGKTRPDHVVHVHARTMAEERVDRVGSRGSSHEEGSVEDVFGNCPTNEPPSASLSQMQRVQLRNHEPVADKDSMCDREDDNHAEQEPEEIRDETVKRSLPKRFTKSQGIL